jgi:hypothetical protein
MAGKLPNQRMPGRRIAEHSLNNAPLTKVRLRAEGTPFVGHAWVKSGILTAKLQEWIVNRSRQSRCH